MSLKFRVLPFSLPSGKKKKLLIICTLSCVRAFGALCKGGSELSDVSPPLLLTSSVTAQVRAML